MKLFEMLAVSSIALWVPSLGLTADTSAAAVADCTGVQEIKSKSRPWFEGQTLMVALSALEAQGEAQFTPKYAAPTSSCAYERFAAAGTTVTAIYSPFEQGEHTLHYRFASAGESPQGSEGGGGREVLVLYDGVATMFAKKGPIFFVAEDRGGVISYYAMFRDQPTYAALKPLVTAVLDGSAVPLATVRWPAGAKEPVIDAYDTKRLK